MPTSDSSHYLPPEWGDDERMGVLFRALPPPQQEISRAARLDFWSSAVHAWTAACDKVTFTLKEARQAFLRSSHSPQCLGDVLQHLLKEGSLCTQHDLLQTTELATADPESWGWWGVRLLSLPPRWMWGKLQRTESTLKEQEVLVAVPLLQDKSTRLYDEYWQRGNTGHPPLLRDAGRARTLAELHREVGSTAGSVAALELIVRWLVGRQVAWLRCADGVTYVKLAQPGQTVQAGGEITHTDIVEVQLAAACRSLQGRVDNLTKECADLKVAAKMAAARGDKDQALSLLRRRRRAEASLKVHFAGLDNATACAHQLTDTRVNREVVAAFRSSALALKQLMAGEGSADAAADTMDRLQEVLDECSDVSSVLSSNICDEAEPEQLEAELSALLATAEPDDVITHALDALHIPTHGRTEEAQVEGINCNRNKETTHQQAEQPKVSYMGKIARDMEEISTRQHVR